MDGASNLEELNTRLRACCYIRREKSQVLTELTPKMRQSVEFTITNRAAYDRTERDLRQWLTGRVATDSKFLAALDRDLDLKLYGNRLRLGEIDGAIEAIERALADARDEPALQDRRQPVQIGREVARGGVQAGIHSMCSGRRIQGRRTMDMPQGRRSSRRSKDSACRRSSQPSLAG